MGGEGGTKRRDGSTALDLLAELQALISMRRTLARRGTRHVACTRVGCGNPNYSSGLVLEFGAFHVKRPVRDESRIIGGGDAAQLSTQRWEPVKEKIAGPSPSREYHRNPLLSAIVNRSVRAPARRQQRRGQVPWPRPAHLPTEVRARHLAKMSGADGRADRARRGHAPWMLWGGCWWPIQ